MIWHMGDCCSPRGYRQIFSERSARSDARGYRRRGLDEVSGTIVRLVRERGVSGRTLLEVGGGVGAIEIELLKVGLSRAVSIELTPTYEEEAGALLREHGFDDRVHRQVLDFALAGGGVEPADFVVLNRVLCCYPDMPLLAGAAANHARRALVLSFPNDRWWTRLAFTLVNVALRVARRQFRVFLHPPGSILATAERYGLRPTYSESGRIWHVVALERAA
jgi:magnesium-protoporphyrin O-methyltransferase